MLHQRSRKSVCFGPDKNQCIDAPLSVLLKFDMSLSRITKLRYARNRVTYSFWFISLQININTQHEDFIMKFRCYSRFPNKCRALFKQMWNCGLMWLQKGGHIKVTAIMASKNTVQLLDLLLFRTVIEVAVCFSKNWYSNAFNIMWQEFTVSCVIYAEA